MTHSRSCWQNLSKLVGSPTPANLWGQAPTQEYCVGGCYVADRASLARGRAPIEPVAARAFEPAVPGIRPAPELLPEPTCMGDPIFERALLGGELAAVLGRFAGMRSLAKSHGGPRRTDTCPRAARSVGEQG